MVLSIGMPVSPWQAAQTAAFSAIVSAATGFGSRARSAPTRLQRKIPTIMKDVLLRGPAPNGHKIGAGGGRPQGFHETFREGSVEREGDDRIAPLGVDLRVAARADHDILLAVDFVGGGRSIDACAGAEAPEDGATLGVIRLELAVGLAGEHQPARGRQSAADHRLRRLHAPLHLTGVVVDGDEFAPTLFSRNDLEGAA